MELKVLLLALWSCSGPVQSSVIRRYYWYRSGPRTWQDAQWYCRSEYGGDLASVVTDADLKKMNLRRFQAWIGLKKESSVWTWVNGGARFNTSSFANKEPHDKDKCGKVIYSSTKFYGGRCGHRHFLLCKTADNYFRFVAKTMTWTEGRQSCQDQNSDYLSFTGAIPAAEAKQKQDFPVWIGLHHNGDDWSWINGTHSDYRNWASDPGPGPGPGPESCVAVSSQSRKMSTESCSEAFPFLCYRHNVVLLKEKLSWEVAVEACENLRNSHNHRSFSLLRLEESELKYAVSLARGATTSKVWVGLRFLAGSWFWSDGAAVSLSLSSCPEGHCGALNISSSSIEPSDCSEELSALCYGSGPQWRKV